MATVATNPDWIVRPASARDVDALTRLVDSLGSGMTTVPHGRDRIAQKVGHSERSFAGLDSAEPQYVLVLEDMASGAVLGISAIYPRVGDRHGFFSYKLTRLVQRSTLLDRRIELELLTLSNDYTGATEVGSLAVAPSLRGTGAGRLLARARYMLIAAFPHLFSNTVMAEMRGWQDSEGHSPFWDAIGAHFFGIPFAEADRLSAVEGVGFIAELMPKHPIYTALLPDAARAAIGRPHKDSLKAMNMLLDEDFRYESLVDVFDGGPQIHAARDKIRTVMDNAPARIGKSAAPGIPLLISNTQLAGFRVAQVEAAIRDGVVALPDAARRNLDLADGDMLRAAPASRIRVAA